MSGERIEAEYIERYLFPSKFALGESILDIACETGYSAPLFISAGANCSNGVGHGE